MLAASHRAGWWGLSRLLFVCTPEPLFILKHVLQGSTVALIVWRERALLSPESDIMRVSALHMICSSLKQDTWNSPGLKLCNTQHWVRWYTPSSSCQVPAGVARVMCFRAREIDPESVHSQPEDWLSSLIIPSRDRSRFWMDALGGFHCLAIVWIKLCMRCFFHIQTHICWRILSLSSREAGNQDRHYAYIKVFVPQILSQHNFTAQDAFRFPEEPINFILWMPVCSPFDLELTEHFAEDAFILNLQI